MKRILIFVFLYLLAYVSQAQTVTYPSSFTVALDGSGDFKTIQEAVNSFRDHSQVRVKLFVKNGIYTEKLVIPSWKPNIHILGESKEGVIITGDDFSGKAYPGGKDATGKDKFSTYTSYTVLVDAPDIILENLTIRNTAGRVGQAVALHVEGDRFICRNCVLLGNQDTLFAAREGSRQYYLNCQIEGTTDFIFGKCIAVFQNCTIKSLSDSYITAAATPAYQTYGFTFLDCNLTADPSATKVYLGRPWRPQAKTIFIRTEMGVHILPVGWDNWRNPENEQTVLYAEFQSRGPGARTTERAKWSKQLTAAQAKTYTVERILAGGDGWKPR
ncbi:pectinesterase family protein [Siphonobacter curvatus]|uniref:Pectinesterase n=1 Tax=Siphonobacter curvatus TaxID=2094562 RepID=A0A2S7IK59_9BACT|nr:pectinesterase family protein [Siphonobacter curvatus]PQA57033.1 pectin esterase [Siphonobacter curvatus]